MNKDLLYQIVYRYLNDITPLKTDCGQLCSSACCKGDTGNGMLLFPGEASYLEKRTLDPSWFRIAEKGNLKLLVCNGACPRDHRPLSCRIFPLMPYIKTKDSLEVSKKEAAGSSDIYKSHYQPVPFELQMDLRGHGVCPLVIHSSAHEINRSFVRKVRQVIYYLLKDKEIESFVRELSVEQETLSKFMR